MRQFACLLVLLASFCTAAAQEVRTWTDAQGRKMQAQFVREVDGDVTFIKEGKLITFPLEQLSEADQKFIRDAETDKKVEETARPAGAPAKEAGPDGLLPSANSLSPAETKSNLTKQRMIAEERTWRDLRGKQTVGKFVRMHDGNVVILRGGRVVTLPFFSLSRIDREYLRDLLTARGEASQLPAGMPEDPPTIAEPPTPRERDSDPGASVEVSGSDTSRSAAEPAASSEPVRPAEDRVATRTLPGQSGSNPSGTGPNRAREMSERIRSQVSGAAATEAPGVQPKREVNWRGVVIGAVIGTLIGAVILRAAAQWVLGCEVAYGDAFVAMLLASAVNFGLGLGAGFAYGAITGSEEVSPLLSFIMVPVGFLVQSGVISSKLDTDFGSACKVTLTMYAIGFAVALVFGGVIFTILMLLGTAN